MGERSAFTAGLNYAAGALNAYALEAQMAAFNIANISTLSFKPARVAFATGPGDKGVMASAIKRDGEETEPVLLQSRSASVKNPELSGTDLAEEFIHLVQAKNSFVANARVIGVIGEMGEALLNIKT